MGDEQARLARAKARSGHISARVLALGDEPDVASSATPESRIELLVELTRAAWALTGVPWPEVPRSQWPIRIRRLGEPA